MKGQVSSLQKKGIAANLHRPHDFTVLKYNSSIEQRFYIIRFTELKFSPTNSVFFS